jgi:putative ABC transport system permease protein
MRSLLFDLHDAIRSLRRDRGYAAAVVLTLGLTIGATTAVFSIVDGVLLKPLAFPDAERLVSVREVWQEFVDRAPSLPVNERHLEYWRANTTSFAAMAQYLPLPANVTGAGEASQITVARASGSVFDVLGVSVALGRTLTADDEPLDRPDVAVIGDAIWRTRFAADPAAIGRAIVLDGKPFTIVGVLRPDFRLPAGSQLLSSIDAITPLRVDVGWVGDHNDFAVGRLRDGVTLDQARAELDVLQKQISAIASAQAKEPVTLSAVVTPLDESIVSGSRRGLLLLFAAVAAVLLIACANLANLALSRALGRTRDGAIRAALGAGRGRLIRRAVLEQVALSLAGAAAGLGVAWAALRIFVRTAPVDLPRVAEVALDGRVLVFTAAMALAAGLLVAILPAWRVASVDVQASLRSGGTTVGVDRGGMRARSTLLAVQVALSVTLIVVTALLGASLRRVLSVDRGFSSDRVMVVPIAMPQARYADDAARIALYDRLIPAIKAVPAVAAVSMTSLLPLRGEGQVNFIVADGVVVPRSEQPSANFRMVAPEFFETLQLPLRRGRSFTDADRRPTAPAVISESVAERLWPGQDPIGKRFSRGIDREPGFEVVGMTADARTTSVEEAPPLMVYVPYWWRSRAATSLLVRSVVDPATVLPDVRRVIREIDPEIAIGRTRRLDDDVAAATAGRRYQAGLFTTFGAMALFIAAVGVYAVTAYSLSRRRREMNLRVALGAAKTDVLAMVVRQGAVPILLGVIGGVAGALAIGGAVASLLYEVRPRDPVIMSAVALLVGAIAVATTLVAARQGLSINPVAALREE